MTLSAGSRLGPYEILAPLGAGGMGEVYRARDTRLERTVAVKVLPQHMSASPEVRQRFEREAKTISQLSHPHICALYDVGREGETEYLVMELLEGETLSERLAKGPLPLEQTLRYGVEVADALDKAHRQGIVHRDLKPGNVMLTKSGVKLLDFGLAKAMTPAAPQASLTALPTQQGLTQEGTILGTFQYMAPEQLEGKEADARTDIFALGATLYEMATGRKAFSGTSQASLIGAILHTEPPAVSSIQPMSPPVLDRVVKTCFAKDPEDRWQSAHDVGQELRWIAEAGSRAELGPRAAGSRTQIRIAWAVAAALLAAFALSLTRWRPSAQPFPSLVASLLPPADSAFDLRSGPPAISPDGLQLAFVASTDGGESLLWVRTLNASSDPDRPLLGTERACCPFWSPDGRRLGFFADGKLKRVQASGAAPETLCEAREALGGTWNQQGIILFAPGPGQPIHQVASSGGPSHSVTRLDTVRGESFHSSPLFLPDGRRFLFGVATGATAPFLESIHLGSLDGGTPRRLVAAQANAAYALGYLLFWRDRVLRAQRFDWKRGVLEGESFQIAEDVEGRPQHVGAYFAVSQNGLLVYARGGADLSRLLWFDRSGRETGSLGTAAYYYYPRLSHDGRRLAVDQSNLTQQGDVWIHDLSRTEATRLTFDVADETAPNWSPHDDSIVFLRAAGGGADDLFRKLPDRPAAEEPLFVSPARKHPTDWSPDERFILFTSSDPEGGGNQDLWVLSLEGNKAAPVVATRFDEWDGQFSPDGHWIAYVSDESGRPEVYAQPFPSPGPRRKVSTAGGLMPKWRNDGTKLFYVAPDRKVMAVPVRRTPNLEVGVPAALFQTQIRMYPPFRHYDVSPDGERFLVVTMPGKEVEKPITLVVNWTSGARP
ncbi:MAG TPA: protein kinase [Thermoanaerobaculia bacterium]